MSVVLVTGGCGYIGSHVVWALVDAGNEVIVLDDLSTGSRRNVPETVEVVVGDVGDGDCLARVFARRSISSVVHLAGKIVPSESILDPAKYFHENTAKSVSLLRCVLSFGVSRFLFSSTAAVYGASATPMVSEGAPTLPISPYGQSKLMFEQVLSSVSAATNLRSAALRYFNVAGADVFGRCGPRGATQKHLIKAAVDVALNRDERLMIYGNDYDTADGTGVRDYIHVSDLAQAHVAVLQSFSRSPGFAVLNCGYGVGVSVLEVVRAVERVIGRKLPYEIVARRLGDPPALIADPTALRKLGTWSPRFADLDAVIRSALAWEAAKASD